MTDTKKLEQEHQQLNQQVKYLRWHYYYGEPKVSDYEFDMLYQKLLKMEEHYPDLEPDQTTVVAPSVGDKPENPYL